MATCIDQPGHIIGVAGADYNVDCTFKNSGKTAWPKNVQLKLINGSKNAYKSLGLDNERVQPEEELNVSINVKLPEFAGKKNLTLKLVYGDDLTEFGDEVTVTLQVNQENHETQQPNFDELLEAIDEPLNETSGNTFYVGEDDETEAVNQLDVSADSWIVVDEKQDNPAPSPQPKKILYEMQRDEDETEMKPAVKSARPGGRSQDSPCSDRLT